MAIFAVTAPSSNQKIGPAIEAAFPNEHIQTWLGHWFVSASGTAKEVSERLGIPGGGVGTAIVVSVANYWGRANTDVWEWLKEHWSNK